MEYFKQYEKEAEYTVSETLGDSMAMFKEKRGKPLWTRQREEFSLCYSSGKERSLQGLKDCEGGSTGKTTGTLGANVEKRRKVWRPEAWDED
jgi:hypothetical protein